MSGGQMGGLLGGPVGIFGGTFDPVHFGHLSAATEVRDALGIEDFRFLPAGTPPHRKRTGARASDRVRLLELALRHASRRSEEPSLESNERLEFLGDSVVGLVVAHRLFEAHPEWAEGDLTRALHSLVDKPSLARLAGELGLGEVIELGGTELRTSGAGKPSILGDAMEAVIGAVYLDAGLGAEVQRRRDEPVGHRVDAIRAKSVRQTTRFLERAAEKGYETKSPLDPAKRGGTVTLLVDQAPAVVAALAARDILIDCRPDVGLRISPHFYTSDDELDHLFAALTAALGDV